MADITDKPHDPLRKIKAVFFAKNPSKFKPLTEFLAKRGVTVSVFSDAKQGLQVIHELRPEIVAVSWNFKTAAPAKLAELVTKKFNTQCIAFAEEGDAKTAAELSVSNISEIIYAPISGPIVFMRIQKVLKSAEERMVEQVGSIMVKGRSPEKEARNRIRVESLKFALEMSLSEASNKKILKSRSQNLGIVEVKGQDFNGHIFIFSEARNPIPSTRMKVMKFDIEKTLKDTKSGMWTEFDFTITDDSNRIALWTLTSSSLMVSGKHAGEPAEFYFVERSLPSKLPRSQIVDGRKALSVSNITPNERVTFDTYLWLKKNRKFIKYFSRGTIAHSERLEGLTKHGIDTLFVDQKDWTEVVKYEAQNYFNDQLFAETKV